MYIGVENTREDCNEKKVLEYWCEIEKLQSALVLDASKEKRKKADFLEKQENSDKKNIKVYVGKVMIQDALDWIDMGEEFSIKENMSTSLYTILLDSRGMYIKDSFSFSELLLLVSLIKAGQQHDTREEYETIIHNELKKINTEYNAKFFLKPKLEGNGKCIDSLFLDQISKDLCKKCGFDGILVKDIKPYSREVNAGQDDESFYLEDIRKILEQLDTIEEGATIRKYINALTEKECERVEIDVRPKDMEKWLEIEKYPLGIWPSEHSPCLMQQIAVNIAISDEQPIFSVNGPPGTGKTTLLNEVIASNVVERARVMCEYENPNDAFKQDFFEFASDYNARDYYHLDEKLTKYGVIVASNNNKAVENISMEMPKVIKKSRTGYFSSESKNLYFSDIATDLLRSSKEASGKEEAWGLISAKLGKKSNIQSFSNIFFRKIEEYYKKPKPDWKSAKRDFLYAYKSVVEYREKIKEAQKRYIEKRELEVEIQEIKARLEKINAKVEDVAKEEKEKFQKLQAENDKLEKEREYIEDILSELKNNVSPFKRIFRIFFKKDALVQQWNERQDELKEVSEKISKIQEQYQISVLEYEKRIQKQVENSLSCSIEKYKELINKIETVDKKLLGRGYPEDNFWTDIADNDNSQKSSPWINDRYNELRENLFFKAMLLNKAFVLNSSCMHANFFNLKKLWNKGIRESDREASYKDLMNSLLIVVPVISTSLASVHYCFDGIGYQQLGTLIIDEAGQATPQSALGAIWRCRKTIAVGDPFQVEPVSSTSEMVRQLIERGKSINAGYGYRYKALSVQTFADRINKYGALRMIEGRENWIGCPMLVHRRCQKQIFDICNEIAYDNRMIYGTPNRLYSSPLGLDGSAWINVDEKGASNGWKQNVEKQNELAVKMISKAVKSAKGELPDIFIITPFRAVRDDLEKKLQKELVSDNAANWIKDHCGTIHSFQGKEADEVIIVLGCSMTTNVNSAKWVGNKVNIINVAVSRAKNRLYIIGNKELWSKIDYVKTVCEKLTEMPQEELEKRLEQIR